MRYAAAYVLATLAGNTTPDEATIAKILGSVGIDCDKTKAQKVISACKGKNIDQIIAEGTKKLSSLPTGGGAAAASGSAGAPAAAADAKKGAAKEEPKKEEKKKAESDEEGDDMVK
jgi:large subunit ribosomal protein LP2